MRWPWSRKPKQPAPQVVIARYDAADPKHHGLWPNADGWSADSAASPSVRRTMRWRCRNQVENDSVAEGLVDTLANDLIGTGPRLQLTGDNQEENDQVESAFADWAKSINLNEKLRTMRRARATDGECFGIFIDNPNNGNRVSLDIRLIEADQVTSPNLFYFNSNAIDGIEFDQYGNVANYVILRHHPGETHMMGLSLEYDTYPVKQVLHYFKPKRPGQHRGIPDLAPALLKFGYLKRYTTAVVRAAETAADFAAILKSAAPPDGAEQVEPLKSFPIDPGLFVAMPQGWDLSQLQAEQPTTTFVEFRREVISEIARCLHMPLNVALCNSSGYNYSSGRLDWQVYYKSLEVEQEHFAAQILDRIFRAWMEEASRITGVLPQSMRTLDADLTHIWIWPGVDSIDPLKDAQAQQIRLQTGMTTYRDEYAREGKDWEDQLEQLKKESEAKKELGLEGLNQSPTAPQPGQPDQQQGGKDE